MPEDSTKIRVSKLDAGRRQLKTAIELWFAEDDPVSIHTLAAAAHEVIHVVTKPRRDMALIFDSDHIREDRRSEVNQRLKEPANFFKHARNDLDGITEFSPALSEGFILFAIFGLQASGESVRSEEFAFLTWTQLHHPDLFTEEGGKLAGQRLSGQQRAIALGIPRNQFLQHWREAAILRETMRGR